MFISFFSYITTFSLVAIEHFCTVADQEQAWLHCQLFEITCCHWEDIVRLIWDHLAHFAFAMYFFCICDLGIFRTSPLWIVLFCMFGLFHTSARIRGTTECYYRFCNWNAHGCQSLFERSSQRWCFCACAVVGPLVGWPCNNHRWRWSVNTVRWIDANPRPQVAAFFHANANTGLLQQVLCDQLNRVDQTAVPSAQSGDVNEPWEFFVLGRRMHWCWYQLRWYVASIRGQCATNVIGCEVGD